MGNLLSCEAVFLVQEKKYKQHCAHLRIRTLLCCTTAHYKEPQIQRVTWHSAPLFVWAHSLCRRICNIYQFLDMLETIVNSQLKKISPATFFQQDGTVPHWNSIVGAFLNYRFPNRWISRADRISWPARSSEVTPCSFSMGISGRHCLQNSCGQHHRF